MILSNGPRRTSLVGNEAQNELGFSLIEVLISGAIMLIVVAGLLPLFTRAITDNIQARRSTEIANEARSEVERLMQLNFNDTALTIASGTALETTSSYRPLLHEWQLSTDWTPDGSESMSRITTIRQYGRNAIADGVLEESEALPAGTAAQEVFMKEIQVEVVAERGQLGSPERRITVRTMRGV